MKGVCVLVGTDGREQGLAVDMGRDGELHQDAVHRRVVVEAADEGKKLLLRGFGGELVFKAQKPALGAILFLVADIQAGGGVVSHQDHRQTGLAGQLRGFLRHPRPQLFGKSLAVENDRHKRLLSYLRK